MGKSDLIKACKKPSVKQCVAIVQSTGRRCMAQAVSPNTFRTEMVKDSEGCKRLVRTDIVNNPDYCQMHQPDKPPKAECKCPYCPVHNPEALKKKLMLENKPVPDIVQFGRKKSKK